MEDVYPEIFPECRPILRDDH